jgi:hypothetical protein
VKRAAVIVSCVAGLVLGGAWVVAQPATLEQPEAAPPEVPLGDDELVARLTALRPTDALAYFELAEEVMYAVQTPEGDALARQLLVLSYELDSDAPAPIGLGRSVCLALAELTRDVDERRWLVQLAQALGSGSVVGGDAEPLEQSHAEAARLLARYRAGDWRRLRGRADRIELERALREAGVEAEDAAGIAADVRRDARAMRPDERIEPTGRGDDTPAQPHRVTGGNPGPDLDGERFLRHLGAELALLNADLSSWGAEAMLGTTGPVRDLDTQELSSAAAVSPERPFWTPGSDGGWRDGQWSDAPDTGARGE